jgi:aryl-phospho-beta-D-glucosidase BglC (GH1 family)
MRILIALSLFFNLSYAQLLSTSGSQIVDDNNQEIILKGVGLGGWMLQEGYMMNSVGGADTQYEFKDNLTALIGAEETQIFYDNWLTNFVTETDIETLANLGYNSVRLAMHYNLFTLPIQEESVEGQNTWLSKGFEMVDDLLDWCEANQIYLILDLHAAPGGQGANSGISDYNPAYPPYGKAILTKVKP